jgi:hypothetical protein
MSTARKTTDTRERNQAKRPDAKNDRGAPPQIVKPLLPAGFNRMLKGHGTDKDLECITVRFYDKGMQDITFVVRKPEGGTMALSAGQYQVYRNNLEPTIKADKEEGAAQAFFTKLEARCWIKCSVHSSANARKVKSLAWPGPVLTAFHFSQKEIKTKKLTSMRMFQIWKGLSDREQSVIEAFQKDVDPAFSWKSTIQNYSLFAEKVSREEKDKALKKVEVIKVQTLKPGTEWADEADELLPAGRLPFQDKEASDPFAGLGDGEEEDDPLDRPLSPKPKAEEEKKEKKKGIFSSLMSSGKSEKTESPKTATEETDAS